MIFLVQFGINKLFLNFSKTPNCTRPTVVLIYSKLHSKSCDYLYEFVEIGTGVTGFGFTALNLKAAVHT